MYTALRNTASAAAAAKAAAARPTPPAPLTLAQKKQMASLYRDLQLPTLAGAHASGRNYANVDVTLSQRDLALDAMRKWSQTYTPADAEPGAPAFEPVGFPIDTSNVVASVASPSGRLLAVVRTTDKKSNLAPGGGGAAPAGPGPNTNPAANKVWWIEVLTRGGAVLASVATDHAHGRIYTALPFGGLAWSAEEDALAYAAEPAPPARRSLFESLAHGPESKVSAHDREQAGVLEADVLGGTGADYTADWGEQLNNIASPALYVLDIAARAVVKVPGCPDASVLSSGQPQWAYGKGQASSRAAPAAARGLVFVGVPVTPRRYGLIFYNSRPSQLYYVPVPAAGALVPLATAPKPASAAPTSPPGSPIAESADADASKGPAPAKAVREGVTAVCLTPGDVAVSFARFAPGQASVAYYSTNLTEGDAPVHCTTTALRLLAWPEDLATLAPAAEADAGSRLPVAPTQAGSWEPHLAPLPQAAPAATTVVPVVGGVPADSAFPGLYPGAGDPDLTTVWLNANTLALSSMWRSTMEVVLVSVTDTTAALYRLRAGDGELAALLDGHDDDAGARAAAAKHSAVLSAPSVSILDVVPGKDELLVAAALPSSPPVLYRVKVPALPAAAAHAVPLADAVTSAGPIPFADVVGAWTQVTPAGLALLAADAHSAAGGYAESPAGGEFFSRSFAAPLTVAAIAAAQDAAGGVPRVAVPDTAALAGALRAQRSFTQQIPFAHADNQDPAHAQDKTTHFESIVTLSTGPLAASRGVILFPHGGPHSAFTTGYDPASAFFAAQGWAVVKVNYRGSVGFGQAPLVALAGACGRMDVDDCMAALHAALPLIDAATGAEPGTAAAAPCYLFGGSHGGFLVTHLCGQFPGRFTACVARNPVISLPYTVATSDIPDWCFTEAGVPFAQDYAQTPASLARMWAVSPLAHADKYTTPTLLAIGTGDRRVPPEQSYDLYRLLQARGVPSRLSVYQAAQHGLADRPLIHADSIVSAGAWFAQFSEPAQAQGKGKQ